ncbi:MAG: InlB B-repeat-containing protein [Tenericutes bacterium]|nr:InlB B-repeat-containing protein [Mycoplasmatota bacterium]
MRKKIAILSFFVLLFTFFGAVTVKADSPVNTSFNFTIETKVGTADAVVSDLGLKEYGSSVTIDAGTYNPSYEFAFYIVNGKVEASLPESHDFLITSDLEITALYKPDATFAVAFMDSNQEMLDVQFVSSGGSALAPDPNGMVKPGYVLNEVTPWSGSYTGVTQDTVCWVQYVSAVPGSIELTVTNGSADQATYDFNEVATLTASGTGNFQFWMNQGMIVSQNPTYSFTVVEAGSYIAIYDETEASPDPTSLFVSLVQYSGYVTDYRTFVGQFVVPAGEDLVEYGYLVSDYPGGITFQTPDVQKMRANKYNPETNEFVGSFSDATYSEKTIRAYVVTTDGVDEAVTYSDAPFVRDLIISEIIEEGGNKAVEIYNGTGHSVDLTPYTVELYANANLTPGSTEDLTGILKHNEVYVIYNSASAAEIIAAGDLADNGIANFNGNDSVVLKKSGAIIDNVGQIGDDGYFCNDATLVRKSSVVAGDSVADDVFDRTIEWDVYPQNTYSYLGFHIMREVNPPVSITLSGAATVVVGGTTQLSVTTDPVDANNDIIWYSSDEAVVTVDQSGIVTGVAQGTATVYAYSLFNHDVLDSHSIEVPAPATYTVTYEENGGSLVSDESGISSGSTATEPADPTRTGYKFNGWYTDDVSFNNLYDFETSVVSNTDLFAQWLEEFTVTFDTDSGTSVDAQTVADTEKATLPDPEPTKADHTFNGWYVDSFFDVLFDFDNEPITGDTTIYAEFLENFTVTFDSNGGSAVSPEEVGNGLTANEPADPTKADKEFGGWYSDLGLTTEFVFTTEITVDITLYAKWNEPAAGSELMIYEVYGGGGNSGSYYKNDYIVLYNSSGSAIDLTGYSVQYASSSGTSWSVTTLSGSIGAGEYYLIQENAGSGGTADLPTPDAIGSISMAGTGGKVALVSSTTPLSGSDPSGDASVIDFVGYGSANAYEGTGSTPAPSNTKSVQRTSFIDTNDNSADFAAVTPDLSYLSE